MNTIQMLVLLAIVCICCWAGYKFAINKKDIKKTLEDMKETVDETVDEVKDKIKK